MKITINLKKASNIDYYGTELKNLDMEEYINGCVAQEVGNSNIEVCKAQAIAARTNAYYYAIRNKNISDQSSSFQAFNASRIANSTYSNAQQASIETAGLILAYNNKPIYPASFSASNGGHVSSSKERWGSDRAWLQSFDDPYDEGKKVGHGVGMSQRGAKKMASLGFNYKDILSFYYPNTTIIKVYGEEDNKVMKAQQVIDYCESRIGCGYVYGASGQIATQSFIEKQKAQYDSINLSVVSKWIGKQVYDCAGFTRMAMQHVDIKIVSGASSQWKKTKWAEKGTIDTIPKNKVCLVYRATSPTVMQHTGVYCGNGYVIDARGSSSGVIKSKLESYKWTHWGIPDGLYDNEDITENAEVINVLYKATVTASSGSTVNLRSEPSSGSERIAKIALDQEVEVLEETNTAWAKIMWNNKIGYMMKIYLKTDAKMKEEENWYVRIKCGSKTEAESLAKLLNSATISN